ncbi:MAG: diphosphomevalonate decarboxylase [Lewinella sp.]|nr:diphosphomevalonate decarboxylase [Lewinella sp.]
MDYTNSKLIIDSKNLAPGALRWRSPSNIAIVKYWGKYGRQLPRNPSVSLTLQAAATDTTLRYTHRQGEQVGIELDFRFAGEARPDFAERVQKFLAELLPVFPFLKQLHLQIDTDNSFPHSAGIASSASAMSALALALCSLERELFGTLEDEDEFLRKASYIARLGSGSACRSVYPHAAVWGETGAVEGASNEYAVPLTEGLHEVFQGFHDDILIISRAEKSVSSSVGHGLMEGNRYADLRYQEARQHMNEVVKALQLGDLDRFGRILEAEALTLHALMMMSAPPYLLMQPNTIAAIQRVQAFRRESGHPLYFTLDAGPNLHLLYPDSCAAPVQTFIREELTPLCQDGFYIADRCGQGPEQLPVSQSGDRK